MKYLERKRRYRPPYRVDSTGPDRQTDGVSARDLERLATALRDRRAELALTQEEFVRRAGQRPDGKPALSVKQLQRLEGHQVSPRPQTLGALDRAAGWSPGSARRILEGGSPTMATAAPSLGEQAVDQLSSLDGAELLEASRRWLMRLSRTEFDQALQAAERLRRATVLDTERRKVT